MRMLNFEFHPLPHLTYETLKADAARFPEVSASFANEENSLQEEVVTDSWRISDAIVCASSLTRRSLEHVGCDPSKITVVPYGFRDRSSLPPVQARADDGKCRFLFVGQGIQRKGLHHLVRAWQAAGLSDCELTLVCYHIDPGIRDLITSPSIKLLGRQSRDQLQQIYASADVFVMPSLVEGFGLVYLEAIERGCHVIGTHDTGLPDLPLSSDAVTVLASGDLDALQSALHELRRRKLARELDPVGIQAEIDKWTWQDFRRTIADHARRFLDS
jgi:glycosyltransferase involved in cell wall biosynthesis